MPRCESVLKYFMKEKLDSDEFVNLKWIDLENQIFCLILARYCGKYKKNEELLWRKHNKLLQAYNTKMKYSNPLDIEYSVSRGRILAALKRSDYFECLPSQVKNCFIFRFRTEAEILLIKEKKAEKKKQVSENNLKLQLLCNSPAASPASEADSGIYSSDDFDTDDVFLSDGNASKVSLETVSTVNESQVSHKEQDMFVDDNLEISPEDIKNCFDEIENMQESDWEQMLSEDINLFNDVNLGEQKQSEVNVSISEQTDTGIDEKKSSECENVNTEVPGSTDQGLFSHVQGSEKMPDASLDGSRNIELKIVQSLLLPNGQILLIMEEAEQVALPQTPTVLTYHMVKNMSP